MASEKITNLILTRRVGERLLVGDNIVITVTRVKFDNETGANVSISISAPESVVVLREEVKQRNQFGRGPKKELGV